MTRVKNFDSTGIAPGGRLFAGDVNAIQDQYADLFNLLQSFGVGSVAVGESGLQIVRFGAGEARVTGHLRTDGILRALGGFYAGAFTTTARDAIAAGSRPFGLIILNTTTNRLEINMGTDPAPAWQGLSASITSGLLGSRPGAAPSNANNFYYATDDNGGTLYFSTGAAWTKAAKGLTEAPVAHAAAHLAGGADAISWVTVHNSGTLAARPAPAGVPGYYYFATDDNGGTLYQAVGGAWVQRAIALNDSRLSDVRTPTDNSVSTIKVQNLAITTGKIADAAVTAAKLDPAVPIIQLGQLCDWPWAASGIPAWSLLPYGQLLTQVAFPAMQVIADTAGRPYGGVAATNFNLPDLRGAVTAGKDDMGGTAANRITAAVSGTAGTVLGALIGAEGITLTSGQLPTHAHDMAEHVHSATPNQIGVPDMGNADFTAGSYTTFNTGGIIVAGGYNGVTNVVGSGSAHRNMQPTLIVNKFMRVL